MIDSVPADKIALVRELQAAGHRVLMLGDDNPATVPWWEIDKIRAEENDKNPMVLRLDEVNGRRRKRKRHNKKARHKRHLEAAKENEPFVVTSRCWGFSKSHGTWEEPEAAPDPEQQARLDLLHKAMGLVA